MDERRRPWFLLAGVCLAWVLSGGLKLSVFGFHPYDVVRSLVPGFDELRTPSRFAVLGELFLLGPGRLRAGRPVALGPAGPARRWPRRSWLLAVVEVSIAPVRLFEPQPTARWAQWLDGHARGDRPVTAFVPFPPSGQVAEFQRTTERMVQAVDTRLTTVNGYSGLFPDRYEFLANVMYGYPNERGDAALRRYGVRYLVVSTDWMSRDPRRPRWLATRHRKLYEDGGTVIYEFSVRRAKRRSGVRAGSRPARA